MFELIAEFSDWICSCVSMFFFHFCNYYWRTNRFAIFIIRSQKTVSLLNLPLICLLDVSSVIYAAHSLAMFDNASKHHNLQLLCCLLSLFSSVSSFSYGYVCDSFALSYLQSIWQNRWSSAPRAIRRVLPRYSSIRSSVVSTSDAIGSFGFRGMLWMALGSVGRPTESCPDQKQLSWPAIRWTQWWQRFVECAFWWQPCPAMWHRRMSRTAPRSGRTWCQPNRIMGLVSVECKLSEMQSSIIMVMKYV